MLHRRTFIQKTATLSVMGLLASRTAMAGSVLTGNIGIQLFSLPALLEKDTASAFAMLSKMGYTELELYGPYPFSAASAHDRWNTVTPALGFSGSGYFGHSLQEINNLLKQYQLTAPSMHTDLDSLQTKMPEMAEAAHQLGHKYVVLPAIPDELRKTPDDYKRMADIFNAIGASAKKEGIQFAYHNHGYGLSEMNGQVPLYTILDNTDPALVFFEMDLFWTTAGGADPIALLEKYSNRYHLMHVKDMKEKVRFSGDGGDAGQWIALFPYMTTAGNGVLDLKTILTKAKENGVKHVIVEQDMVANPEDALKKSFDYLASLGV